LRVWRNTPTPHHNRSRKTLQTQKTTQNINSHVVAVKPKNPHKEKKDKTQKKEKRVRERGF
jgi:hypothetical protein